MLLTLLPLLIHIINLVRHQRVQWAAMEFLLASYKKHRRWYGLKQFLLMLCAHGNRGLDRDDVRAMVTHDQWLAIFGGKVIHHYVLLDDTYSMSQQSAELALMPRLRVLSHNSCKRLRSKIPSIKLPCFEPRESETSPANRLVQPLYK